MYYLNNVKSSQDYMCSPMSNMSKSLHAYTKRLLFILLIRTNRLLNNKIRKCGYSFFTVVTFLSAPREHQLPGVLGGRQVPQSGPLPGLVCVVCVLSDACCRVAAGQTGNYIYSNDQNGWSSLSAQHCWRYGWVVRLSSVSVVFIIPLLHKICVDSRVFANKQIQIYIYFTLEML